jgi:hypothetical protein
VATAEETAAIREEARRRWLELERQIARRGADSPPEDVLEAEDLRRKWGFALNPHVAPVPVPTTPAVRDLEMDWLRTLIASALRSNQEIKFRQDESAVERHRRDRIVYLGISGVVLLQIVIIILFVQFAQRFGVL